MRFNSAIIAAISGQVAYISAQVELPPNDDSWRALPIMPGVFLEDSTTYALWANGGGYTMTVRGQVDNGGLSPIASDGVDKVARGFFLQDMTYGFDSLDGFVTWFNSADETWDTTSMIIEKQDYDIGASALNLTDQNTYPSDNKWTCSVEFENVGSPTYEQVICSRPVSSSNDFDTKQIKYQARVVVNAIGYRYYGTDSGASEWVFGGQVSLDTLEGGAMAGLSAPILMGLIAVAYMTF